uniref:ABC transmembrane type-2 domain-containing protein n=1 Tax=Dasya naccarioides TaxID=2007180 RepID=A0A1Z1MGQ4_9FLOR|nr:hypothetical protein [Dasya naccarioides]ARW65247.1 hypothetical protein [Dasya naccarioides]
MKYKNTILHKQKILKPQYKIKVNYSSKYILTEIKTLTKRLYTQTIRRPISIITNIIQPLIWLILFGALFKNAPIDLIQEYNIKYSQFLSYGIIAFTAFSSSLNAGLPIIFDREFGFLNRILISPLIDKNSLFSSLITYTFIINIIQIIIIITFSINVLNNLIKFDIIFFIINITTILIIHIATLSIGLSFIVPGHIEFLGFTLIINLPALFTSTALAPLNFMPYWLQAVALMNPLTYSIEIIRYISLNSKYKWENNIINTLLLKFSLQNSTLVLIITTLLVYIIINKIIKYKYN